MYAYLKIWVKVPRWLPQVHSHIQLFSNVNLNFLVIGFGENKKSSSVHLGEQSTPYFALHSNFIIQSQPIHHLIQTSDGLCKDTTSLMQNLLTD